jgi:tetratricopeptide (TPR) repeat protein
MNPVVTRFETIVAQARATRHAGDLAGALALYRDALAAAANETDRAHCLRHIGDLARAQGLEGEAVVALRRAETIYRAGVGDTLSLANTVRLLALVEGNASGWQEARALYAKAADESGRDLREAIAECDHHIGPATS